MRSINHTIGWQKRRVVATCKVSFYFGLVLIILFKNVTGMGRLLGNLIMLVQEIPKSHYPIGYESGQD